MLEQDALTRVIRDVVGPRADEIDRTGAFPRDAIDALQQAGVLGWCSATEVGGGGGGLGTAAEVVERLAEACASTAMVVMMHYAATAVIEAAGPEDTRRAIAAGTHLTTLAFSEAGSRSHFWSPLGTATVDPRGIRLDAVKSWVTSAGEADSYVWSSRPVGAAGPMTLWLVPARAPGLTVRGRFDGLGLRGNASCPVHARGVLVPGESRLGEDGAGLDLALGVVLPWFLVCSAAVSVGIMRATTAEAASHLTSTRLEHLDRTLARDPGLRSDLAQMQILTDSARSMLDATLAAVEGGHADATLRVLEVKAYAAETAITVTDLAMKVCGGAAFRRELGIERRFRDARAARIMAPTTDALRDFIGRTMTGQPLLDDAA